MNKLVAVFALSASLLPSASGAATIQYGELTREEYCQILEFEMQQSEPKITQTNLSRITHAYLPLNEQERQETHAILCAHRLLIS